MAVRTLSCVQRASEEEAPAYERQHRTTSPESTPDASGPLPSDRDRAMVPPIKGLSPMGHTAMGPHKRIVRWFSPRVHRITSSSLLTCLKLRSFSRPYADCE